MMTKYKNLYEFTDTGRDYFIAVMNGDKSEDALDLADPSLVQVIDGTHSFEVQDFSSSLTMANAILLSLGGINLSTVLKNNGLWCWLTFVLRDIVTPRDKNGARKLGEISRWLPSNPDDYQKAQRHLIRMPVLLREKFGKSADHLLCGKPSVRGELMEQLTSQGDMFNASFQNLARTLYYDEANSKLKKGSGTKGGGSPRRLAKIKKQFEVNYDIQGLDLGDFLNLLPSEFDRYCKP